MVHPLHTEYNLKLRSLSKIPPFRLHLCLYPHHPSTHSRVGKPSPAQPETLNDPVLSISQPFLSCSSFSHREHQAKAPSSLRPPGFCILKGTFPDAPGETQFSFLHLFTVPRTPISPCHVPAHDVALWVWDNSRKFNTSSLFENSAIWPLSWPQSAAAETEHEMAGAVAHQ